MNIKIHDGVVYVMVKVGAAVAGSFPTPSSKEERAQIHHLGEERVAPACFLLEFNHLGSSFPLRMI